MRAAVVVRRPDRSQRRAVKFVVAEEQALVGAVMAEEKALVDAVRLMVTGSLSITCAPRGVRRRRRRRHHPRLSLGCREQVVRMSVGADDASVQEAICAAAGLGGLEGYRLLDRAGAEVTPAASPVWPAADRPGRTQVEPSVAALAHWGVYTLSAAAKASPVSLWEPQRPRGSGGDRSRSREAKLHRVLFACVGLGERRESAVQALRSAYARFGGDCIVSLYLLTDDTAAEVPQMLNVISIQRGPPRSTLGLLSAALGGCRG